VLEVADTAPGIPIAARERVFDRFAAIWHRKNPEAALVSP